MHLGKLFLTISLVGISAPTPGSGKSLLVDAISIIVTGEQAPRFAPTSSREEERKRLFSIALAGHSLLLIDNVPADTPLGSPALDAALTAGVIRDRILGHSQTASAPWQTCVFATGNHLSVQGDLGRRTIPIHLDPRMEHPETRSDFRHADLVGWITETRGAILGAILTVVRGYIRAGCPAPTGADGKPLRPLGSFEPWCQSVRNAVLWAGWADPAARQAAMTVEATPELASMAELLDAWHGAYGSDPRTLSEVVKVVKQESASEAEKRLYAALQNLDGGPSPSGELNTRSLGEHLKKYKDRIIHGFRLEQSIKRGAKGHLYWVINTLAPEM
jgi:putative DNA primase/helicase